MSKEVIYLILILCCIGCTANIICFFNRKNFADRTDYFISFFVNFIYICAILFFTLLLGIFILIIIIDPEIIIFWFLEFYKSNFLFFQAIMRKEVIYLILKLYFIKYAFESVYLLIRDFVSFIKYIIRLTVLYPCLNILWFFTLFPVYFLIKLSDKDISFFQAIMEKEFIYFIFIVYCTKYIIIWVPLFINKHFDRIKYIITLFVIYTYLCVLWIFTLFPVYFFIEVPDSIDFFIALGLNLKNYMKIALFVLAVYVYIFCVIKLNHPSTDFKFSLGKYDKIKLFNILRELYTTMLITQALCSLFWVYVIFNFDLPDKPSFEDLEFTNDNNYTKNCFLPEGLINEHNSNSLNGIIVYSWHMLIFFVIYFLIFFENYYRKQLWFLFIDLLIKSYFLFLIFISVSVFF